MRRAQGQTVGHPPDGVVDRRAGERAVQRAERVGHQIPCARHPARIHRPRSLEALRQAQQASTPGQHRRPPQAQRSQPCSGQLRVGNDPPQRTGQLVSGERVDEFSSAQRTQIVSVGWTAICQLTVEPRSTRSRAKPLAQRRRLARRDAHGPMMRPGTCRARTGPDVRRTDCLQLGGSEPDADARNRT